MVNLIVRVMFCTIFIDMAIGFMWVGLLGFIELKDTFSKAFPNAKDKVKCWLNKL